MSLTCIASQEQSLQNELYRMFQHNHVRVKAWVAEKAKSKLITETENSFYCSDTNEIHIEEGAGARIYGHEYGHEFYHRFLHKGKKLIVSEMLDQFDELFDSEDEYAQQVLSLIGRKKEIRILTDFLSCCNNFKPDIYRMGFFGHKKGYSRIRGFDIARNEAFAEFFATLYVGDWICYKFMVDNFPRFVNSCILAIDKGIAATA